MAGVIGLRGPDIAKRDALRGYKVVFQDADRPYIRPHTGAPVLFLKDGAPVVERHVFGFSKDFASFNARSDKLETGKTWSRMFGKHHGVAPVSYFIEWADLGDGKRPYAIERADGAVMLAPALVGAYWEDRAHRAFALVTIETNAFVGRFHDRMIGQLSDEAVDVWLRPEGRDRSPLLGCLRPPPDDELVAYPLAADVGGVRYDDAAAMRPVGPAVAWKDLKRK